MWYASTLTSDTKAGAAKSCTFMRVLVTMSSAVVRVARVVRRRVRVGARGRIVVVLGRVVGGGWGNVR
jgi:hypothetical protein